MVQKRDDRVDTIFKLTNVSCSGDDEGPAATVLMGTTEPEPAGAQGNHRTCRLALFRAPDTHQITSTRTTHHGGHTMHDFREIGQRLSNWGRWGNDDERGTVNLITPEKIVAASQLVKRGAIFDLGIPFDAKGPQPGGGRINPVRLMSETGQHQEFPGAFHYADDYVFMPLQSASQWDGLSHVFYDDKMYNGFPSSDVGPYGAKHCSIDKLAKGIVGRGVLLDIARLKGVDWLEAGTVITPADLDAAAERQGVSFGSGDILVFRTGWRTKFVREQNAAEFMAGEPGLGSRLLPVDRRSRDRCRCFRQLGDRGAPGRGRHRAAAGAHGADPRHGRDPGRDPRPRRARSRLRSRRCLGVPADRPTDQVHRSGRLTDQPAGDQMIAATAITRHGV